MRPVISVASARAACAALMFLAAWPWATSAQPLGDCKCDDVREMRDRWCSARAARNEYERIQRFLNHASAKAGEARMFSNADKLMINQVCVQEAINAVSDQGVGKATARTKENLPLQSILLDDCRIEVTSTQHTACQKQIVEAHENMHSDACKGRLALWNSFDANVRVALQTVLLGPSNATAATVTGDTKYTLTSAQFASEEAASYATEMQIISAKWAQLQQDCIAQAFEAELANPDIAGKDFWDRITPDANGKRIYKMYDLSNDPCPDRPRPPKSACTLR
jgi:hypothetical protein